MSGEPRHGERIENPFALSSDQEHRATPLVVASASVDAEACALLLATLGLRPARQGDAPW